MDRNRGYSAGDKGKRAIGGKPAKKQKRPSRLTVTHKILIVICALLALTVVVVAVYRAWFVRPDLPGKGEGLTPGASAEEVDYGDGVRPRADGTRKSKDFYTILVLGRDTGGGGNTDTMLLASYDVTNQKATVMSIPRDTMVNVSWDVKRINSVYNTYGGGDKGLTALYREISQLVGFEPDFQVVVEWEAVGNIVDAIGGVYFDVPRDMNYEDPYQDLSIHQKKGYRLLTGDDAMQVIRYRHDNRKNGKVLGYPDGDLGRIKTQQDFLKAVVDQLLQFKNVTKINSLINVFQENVETDLSFQNILWFAQSAIMGGLTTDNVTFVTMPNTPRTCWSRSYNNMQSYVVPNARELLALVNDSLSPFAEPSTLSDLDIMSVNSDGSISSTTGNVEDKKAAVPPVKPSKEPEVTEETPEDGEATVPEDGTTTPPTDGTTTPPSDGTTTPPANGGTTTPPSDGGTTTPPANGGTTTPPADGGTTTPPADGGTTTPPADGGVTTPPADTGEGGWSIPGEPASP